MKVPARIVEKDILTSSERMKALVSKKELDRVPVNPMASVYTALRAGISVREFYLEPEKALRAQELSIEIHKYDGTPSYSIPDWSGWDFGGEFAFHSSPLHALPFLAKRAAQSADDVKRLKLPDPKIAPGAGRMLVFARLARARGYTVSIYGGSPMGIAGSIVGPEVLLRWFYKEPEMIHKLLRLSTDYLLLVADLFIDEFGAENCSAFCTYPLEGHAVVSPKIFENFSLPYVIEMHEQLIGKGVKKWLIHLCGEHFHNLMHWKKIPLVSRSVFTIGHEMDIEKTAEFFGEDYIIGGNVSTTLLQLGSADEVFEECGQIIDKMKYHSGGFILTPACALPPKTPPENVQAMVDAARMFGRYDY
ncbi:MAG: uroporphyrinogen decarboxylase family protein [Actinobacteria bacterium]|nr:uroporphyrinogen decarboxylase family protein [Actinomycetota bacterium]